MRSSQREQDFSATDDSDDYGNEASGPSVWCIVVSIVVGLCVVGGAIAGVVCYVKNCNNKVEPTKVEPTGQTTTGQTKQTDRMTCAKYTKNNPKLCSDAGKVPARTEVNCVDKGAVASGEKSCSAATCCDPEVVLAPVVPDLGKAVGDKKVVLDIAAQERQPILDSVRRDGLNLESVPVNNDLSARQFASPELQHDEDALKLIEPEEASEPPSHTGSRVEPEGDANKDPALLASRPTIQSVNHPIQSVGNAPDTVREPHTRKESSVPTRPAPPLVSRQPVVCPRVGVPVSSPPIHLQRHSTQPTSPPPSLTSPRITPGPSHPVMQPRAQPIGIQSLPPHLVTRPTTGSLNAPRRSPHAPTGPGLLGAPGSVGGSIISGSVPGGYHHPNPVSVALPVVATNRVRYPQSNIHSPAFTRVQYPQSGNFAPRR